MAIEKIDVKRINSKWYVNGKQYKDLSTEEKVFFDEFIIAMRISFEAEKMYNQTHKAS
jgi:hypothetical protein